MNFVKVLAAIDFESLRFPLYAAALPLPLHQETMPAGAGTQFDGAGLTARRALELRMNGVRIHISAIDHECNATPFFTRMVVCLRCVGKYRRKDCCILT